MKKQTLCFQKLLCFHYKYNLIVLDILCIILAIVSSCIFFEYQTVAPQQELVNICESALYDYIESPINYIAPDDVVIKLDKNSIRAYNSKSFFEIIASKNDDDSYNVVRAIQFKKFVTSYIISPIFYFAFNYIFFEFIIQLVVILPQKLIVFCGKFKTFFRIKFSKFIMFYST